MLPALRDKCIMFLCNPCPASPTRIQSPYGSMEVQDAHPCLASFRKSDHTILRKASTTKREIASHSTHTPGTIYPIFCSWSRLQASDSPITSKPITPTMISIQPVITSMLFKISFTNTPNICPILSGLLASLMPVGTSLIWLCSSISSIKIQEPRPTTSRGSWSETESWHSKMVNYRTVRLNTWSTTLLWIQICYPIGTSPARMTNILLDVTTSTKGCRKMWKSWTHTMFMDIVSIIIPSLVTHKGAMKIKHPCS